MKVGQSVHLKYGAQPVHGTVSRLYARGGFQVTYDATRDERGRRVGGGRFDYTAAQASCFVLTARSADQGNSN